MRRAALKLLLIFLLAVFLAIALQAAQPSPQVSPAAAAQQQAQNNTAPPLPAASPSQAEAPKKITAYTLPPALYRKAHTRGRIRFSLGLFGFFYGLLILWFILNRRLSAKYRDWAENFSRKRFLQALIFAPLLALTVGVLQLPLDALQEWIEKLYGISVQPWGSWIGDWAKAQFLVVLIGIPLAITAQRKETSVGIALSLVVAFSYFIIIVLTDNVKHKPNLHPEFLIWLPNFIGSPFYPR